MKRTAAIFAIGLVLVLGGFLLIEQPVTAEEDKPKESETDKSVNKLRKQAKKTNLKLMINGKYSCCIAPGCTFCTMAMGHCPCVKRLAEGKSVCHTCKGGWEAGHGSVPGVKQEKVKAFSGAELKKVYDERKKALKRKKRK